MSRKPQKPLPVSYELQMSATVWRCVTDYGSCVGCDPGPVSAEPWGNAWTVRLPRIEDNAANKIGYLLCPHTVTITAGYLSGLFTLTLTTGTQFVDAKTPSDGITPATFRFIIMGGLDSASMSDPDKRWWSNPVSATLRDGGPWSLNAPLTPENWSNVNGLRYRVAFTELLKAPQYVGITFGAGGDFGHGVATVGGTAHLKAEGIKFT